MTEKSKFYRDTYEFENVDKWGRGVRFGFVVAVSDGRGGKKAWGDQVFQTQSAAASTARLCAWFHLRNPAGEGDHPLRSQSENTYLSPFGAHQ